MKAIELFALVGIVAMVAVACRNGPEESANPAAEESANTTTGESATAPTEEAASADAAPEAEAADTAATEETGDAPAERAERPQPEPPRAEGDRLAELLSSDDYLLLDVRRPDEIEELGTVEGYLNIPIEELADRLEEVPRDRPILTA